VSTLVGQQGQGDLSTAENNRAYLCDLFSAEERVEVKDDFLKEGVAAGVL